MATNEKEIIEMENRRQDGKLTFSKKEIQTIKNTVAKDANEDEFRMFMALAKRYGLDPFNKEIFFWKIDGKPTIMTSRDGYLKIADRHEEYDGLVSDVVRKNDNFRRKKDDIDHEYGTDRGEIIGAYALVYRKDRKYPVYVFAPYDEYRASTKAWNQYPSAMILKVAESMSLKRAFTVSGLVSREEMQVTKMAEESVPENITPDRNIKKKSSNSKKLNKSSNNKKKGKIDNKLSDREKEIKEIIAGNKKLKKELYDYLQWIKEEKSLDKVSINDLDEGEYEELKDILNKVNDMASKLA